MTTDIRIHARKHRYAPTYHGCVTVWDGRHKLYTLHVDADRLTRKDALADAEWLRDEMLAGNEV